MRNLLYIVILMVVTGCGISSSRTKVLDEAQSLMCTNPEAALERLNGLDVSEFKDSATMARWALLYSEAIAANHLTTPSDTIVNIAIDYYSGHNLTDEYQKASRLKSLIRSGDKNDKLASSLYLQKVKEFMLYKERIKREQFVFVGLIILVIALGVIVWMRQQLKLKSAQADALMAEASGLKCRIEAKSHDIGKLETTLHGLLDNRFALIDSLCRTYYERQGTKAEHKAIVDKVKSEIEALRSDSFPVLENAVNDCRNNILARIKESLPAIKPNDYQLIVYLASGFSTPTICLLLGESADVVYKRKSRLKSRLKSVTSLDATDISDIF